MKTAAPVFEIEYEGDTVILTPLTDLREADSDRIGGAMREVVHLVTNGPSRNVVFDFRRTDYYGSTALNFFVKVWRRVLARGGSMVFCGLSDHEREILAVTSLDRIWPVCATREEAVAAVATGGLAVPVS